MKANITCKNKMTIETMSAFDYFEWWQPCNINLITFKPILCKTNGQLKERNTDEIMCTVEQTQFCHEQLTGKVYVLMIGWSWVCDLHVTCNSYWREKEKRNCLIPIISYSMSTVLHHKSVYTHSGTFSPNFYTLRNYFYIDMDPLHPMFS